MLHTIAFTDDRLLDLDVPGQDRLVLAVMKRGTRRRAQVLPFVVQSTEGPLEMADLVFEDGSSTSGVRYEHFSFVDEEPAWQSLMKRCWNTFRFRGDSKR